MERQRVHPVQQTASFRTADSGEFCREVGAGTTQSPFHQGTKASLSPSCSGLEAAARSAASGTGRQMALAGSRTGALPPPDDHRVRGGSGVAQSCPKPTSNLTVILALTQGLTQNGGGGGEPMEFLVGRKGACLDFDFYCFLYLASLVPQQSFWIFRYLHTSENCL